MNRYWRLAELLERALTERERRGCALLMIAASVLLLLPLAFLLWKAALGF